MLDFFIRDRYVFIYHALKIIFEETASSQATRWSLVCFNDYSCSKYFLVFFSILRFDQIKATMCVRPTSPKQFNGQSRYQPSVNGQFLPKKKKSKGGMQRCFNSPDQVFFCCNVGEQNEICQIKGENKTQTCLIVRLSTPKCVRPILEKREIFKKLENDQNIFFSCVLSRNLSFNLSVVEIVYFTQQQRIKKSPCGQFIC